MVTPVITRSGTAEEFATRYFSAGELVEAFEACARFRRGDRPGTLGSREAREFFLLPDRIEQGAAESVPRIEVGKTSG